jgi:hypothetical protein
MPKAGQSLGPPDKYEGVLIEDTYRDPDGVGGAGGWAARHPQRDNAEVREALSHCPQCGSGKFTEYRKDSQPQPNPSVPEQ